MTQNIFKILVISTILCVTEEVKTGDTINEHDSEPSNNLTVTLKNSSNESFIHNVTVSMALFMEESATTYSPENNITTVQPTAEDSEKEMSTSTKEHQKTLTPLTEFVIQNVTQRQPSHTLGNRTEVPVQNITSTFESTATRLNITVTGSSSHQTPIRSTEEPTKPTAQSGNVPLITSTSSTNLTEFLIQNATQRALPYALERATAASVQNDTTKHQANEDRSGNAITTFRSDRLSNMRLNGSMPEEVPLTTSTSRTPLTEFVIQNVSWHSPSHTLENRTEASVQNITTTFESTATRLNITVTGSSLQQTPIPSTEEATIPTAQPGDVPLITSTSSTHSAEFSIQNVTQRALPYFFERATIASVQNNTTKLQTNEDRSGNASTTFRSDRLSNMRLNGSMPEEVPLTTSTSRTPLTEFLIQSVTWRTPSHALENRTPASVQNIITGVQSTEKRKNTVAVSISHPPPIPPSENGTMPTVLSSTIKIQTIEEHSRKTIAGFSSDNLSHMPLNESIAGNTSLKTSTPLGHLGDYWSLNVTQNPASSSVENAAVASVQSSTDKAHLTSNRLYSTAVLQTRNEILPVPSAITAPNLSSTPRELNTVAHEYTKLHSEVISVSSSTFPSTSSESLFKPSTVSTSSSSMGHTSSSLSPETEPATDEPWSSAESTINEYYNNNENHPSEPYAEEYSTGTPLIG